MPDPSFAAQQELHALYASHHSWLRDWLRKKLGNSADAADLAHDTFIRLMVGRDLTAINEPRAYLTRVAKGILINWYQRQALERAYLDALAVLPEQKAPSPEQHHLILETLHEIDTLLDRLPRPVKRAFLLSQIEGMKYDAIATELGVSLITVKRYMKQAFLQCLTLMEVQV
ncbi:MAG: fecI14 [Verrucomicrobiaceae bacterium]|nr:fecI14 [Verrucomicrobiaceae bacterium]